MEFWIESVLSILPYVVGVAVFVAVPPCVQSDIAYGVRKSAVCIIVFTGYCAVLKENNEYIYMPGVCEYLGARRCIHSQTVCLSGFLVHCGAGRCSIGLTLSPCAWDDGMERQTGMIYLLKR